MKVVEWITIGAIILGPILAVQIQKSIERYKEKNDRRLNIFKTLMATSGARVIWSSKLTHPVKQLS
jgi:hypothetical protein